MSGNYIVSKDALRKLWRLAYPDRELPSLKSELWKEMGWQGRPTSLAGVRFLELLGVDEMAFDNLYCVAFQMMDAQWLAKRASYMEFNEVLKSTRTQLERELALEDVSSIKDLPAYNLLNQ
ncbi:uncharacterized protein LOC131228095 [Magnolia sinica]|uniref:uncharacterized protein LOC131228095 n=1 Tax=Magnolia sinica TaxID=86752 RepID=UPI0026582164|nr:uncharacterized protein LOC131228095 [Magnolia sinica]